MKINLSTIRKVCFITTLVLLISTFVGCKTEVEGPAGQNGVDGVSIVWLGSFASADEINNPQPMNAYYNTTDGCSYIYDGTKWTLLAKGNYYSNDADNSDSVLVLTLPNDSDVIKLTNDYAPVKVSIPEKYQITNVVWKKGNSSLASASSLLADDTANPMVINFSNVGIFYVSENGWYDVVAQDVLGRCECNHIEVKTIDKTPLGEVKNLAASTKDRTATITWNDVTSNDKYNSSLKSVKVSYVYNDDAIDPNNGSFLVNAGVESATITIPRAKTSEDFIRITVQTVDAVGNISAGSNVITWCSNSVYATEENFRERLLAMTASGEIAIVGECSCETIRNALREIENPEILITLDLSEVTGWTSVPSHGFVECRHLTNIVLPDSITSLGYECFCFCSNLKKISIPDNVSILEEGVFAECTSLSSVDLPKNLSFIGDYCFQTCRSLEELYIPKSVNRLGRGICYLSSIGKVVFEDTNTDWYKTTISTYKYGTKIGPMQGDIEDIIGEMHNPNGNDWCYFYSENYQPE